MKAKIMRAYVDDPSVLNMDGKRMLHVDLYVDMEAEVLFTGNVGKDMIMGSTEGERAKLINALKAEGITK